MSEDLAPFGSGSILEKAGARVTLTSLEVTDPNVSYETLTELLAFAGTVHKASSWWVGDTLNAIEARYGDKVYQAATILDLAEQTIMNMMSICNRIPRSRRRENVKFSTHAEVRALEPEDQTKWLDQAEENGWTKNELRKAIRGQLPPEVEVECRCSKCGNLHTPGG
jgi:hypothetical protein